MKKLQLLIYVFLILWKFEGLIMQNVTFYNEKKSWKEAANFCSKKGGALESNVTLLSEHLRGITQNGEHEDIWLGKSELLTKWTYVLGCFYIYGDFQHFVIEPPETAKLKCQMLCNNYKFYSINGKDCYCIEEILPFHRANNCNCVGCYKVWEHQLPNFGSLDSSKQCIVATGCDGKNLQRSYEDCNENYNATCDNGAKLEYQKYLTAADECETQGSFIKWYPDNYCVTQTLKHQHWTNGRRHKETLLLKNSYDTETFQPLKCFKLDDGSEEQEGCNDNISFFCKFGK
ncbi:uncharacterized protein LOC127732232 [Mytilus californianus]|uniref:uncharacterized protein LOC127732232 n=1 Tax=Mytilus californianus TaxID=6549 RepID=UPI002246457F|nr:uncharacterized protein LOC127732232 [Mytilus californianus]